MKKLLEEMEGYQTEVEVSVFHPNRDLDIEHDDKVLIKYDIDIEHRSWGLKGISVKFLKEFEVRVWEVDEDDNGSNERTITVDPSGADITWREGGMYTPTDVTIRLNEDFTVQSVDMEVVYLNPDYVA